MDDGSFGRIINDSKYFPNTSVKKIVDRKNNPHLAIFAQTKILKGEEVTFFYGEDLPWHNKVIVIYLEYLCLKVSYLEDF